MILRRRWLVAAAAALTAQSVWSTPDPIAVEVWKGPSCGCCKDWVHHLELNGFRVTVHDEGNSDVRQRLRMPMDFASCHTALVQGYAVEGHVPARELRRLLKERPKAIGLAVPGMPRGAPGMDGPEYRGARDPHDVLLILADGRAQVYQAYRS